jgi:hypothetical protein
MKSNNGFSDGSSKPPLGVDERASSISAPAGFLRGFDGMLSLLSGSTPGALHLVDIENLAGTGLLTTEKVAATRRRYGRATGLCGLDLAVVAAGPHNANAVRSGWPGGIYLWRRGIDGADTALIDLFMSLNTPTAFTRLFIGSGDHVFAAVADGAVLSELAVTVVCRLESRSHALAIHHFVPLAGSRKGFDLTTKTNDKGSFAIV